MVSKNRAFQLTIYIVQILIIGSLCAYSWKLMSQNSELKIIISKNQYSISFIVLGLTLLCSGYLLSYFRWYMIMNILSLPVSLLSTLKACSQSDIVGAFTLGASGTDFSRCFLVMKSHPQHNSRILVSIILDRILGLSSLLLLGSLSIILSPVLQPVLLKPHTQHLGYLLWFIIAAATCSQLLFFSALHITGFDWLQRLIIKIPFIGSKLLKLIHCLEESSQHWRFFCLIIVYSLGIHLLMSTGIYCIGRGLNLTIPPWQAHSVTYPLTTLIVILPLPLGGIGLGEVSTDYLYTVIGQLYSIPVQPGTGVIVSLGVKTSCLFVLALLNVIFFLLNHSNQQAAKIND